MATPTRTQADAHYKRQASIAALAVAAIRQLFKQAPQQVPARVATFQYAAAVTSTRWVAGLAGDVPVTNPAALAGWTSEGLPVAVALDPILADLHRLAAQEVEAEFYRLSRAVASQVADAGRTAAQMEFSTRPEWTNYVRMISPPCCARCAVLAGRIYRDIEAFDRHPGCDCQMIPVTDWQDAHDKGLVSSFRAAFDRGEVTGLSKSDQRAIRDGANVSRVVAAHKGLATVDGMKVTSAMAGKSGRWRMRPEAIYKAAGDDFVKRLTLMKQHGYLAAGVDPNALLSLGRPTTSKLATPHRPAQNNRAPGDIFAALEAARAKPSPPRSS